jgi:DNA-binding response OmpR family regulator
MNAIKTILFVEDDPVVLTTYRSQLQREGFLVEPAQDGLTAMKILSKQTPDLIVLDLLLPKFNGVDVIKFIRTDARLKNVPVIILSNVQLTKLEQDPALAGANKRLCKDDCTPQMLVQHVQELLNPAPANATPANEIPIAGVRSEFLKTAPGEIAKIREQSLAYIKAPASAAGPQQLSTLCQSVNSLSTNASKAGCERIALLAKAFDSLLSNILSKPARVTPSILQTIAEAADCLGGLLKGEEVDSAGQTINAKVLTIDDDPVCNHVIVNTLKRANLNAVSVQDPLEGLRLLETSRYNLVLLDISMPNMTGFQVCQKLRCLPHCETIPVIFVTAHSNFENRAQSVLSGGNYLITKPVDPLELALKVTVHLLKPPVKRPGAPQPQPKPAAVNPSEGLPQPQMNQLRNGEAKSMVPSSVMVSATESRNGDGKSKDTFGVVPTTELNPGDVPEEVLQLIAAIQTNEAGKSGATNTVPASVLLPATESRNGEAAERDSARAVIPAAELVPADVSRDALQPDAALPADQPGNGVAESAAPSNTAAPVMEPRAADVPNEELQPDHSRNLVAPDSSVGSALSDSRNQNNSMKNEPNQIIDKIVLEVARIIFGDGNASELNTRLVRIALERDNAQPTFDKIVPEVARIIFGDGNASELNTRLVRIALERYNVPEIINSPVAA